MNTGWLYSELRRDVEVWTWRVSVVAVVPPGREGYITVACPAALDEVIGAFVAVGVLAGVEDTS